MSEIIKNPNLSEFEATTWEDGAYETGDLYGLCPDGTLRRVNVTDGTINVEGLNAYVLSKIGVKFYKKKPAEYRLGCHYVTDGGTKIVAARVYREGTFDGRPALLLNDMSGFYFDTNDEANKYLKDGGYKPMPDRW